MRSSWSISSRQASTSPHRRSEALFRNSLALILHTADSGEAGEDISGGGYWVDSFKEKSDEDDPEHPFGVAYGWGEEREFIAKRLLILPKEKLTQRQANEMAQAAEPFAALLHTWVEVIARADLHQGLVSHDEQGGATFVWLNKGKPPGKILKGRHKLILSLGSAPKITPTQWGRVLAEASVGARPPEAHVFLRDARHAKNISQFRRSVLDSATAAELGLPKLRDEVLADSDARLGAYMRGRVRQIDGISKFLSRVGRKVPIGIKEEIAEPRNKAIHGGHDPDKETATRALEKAGEVLDLASPWKKLL